MGPITRFTLTMSGAEDSAPLLERVVHRVRALGDDVRTLYAPR